MYLRGEQTVSTGCGCAQRGNLGDVVQM